MDYFLFWYNEVVLNKWMFDTDVFSHPYLLYAPLFSQPPLPFPFHFPLLFYFVVLGSVKNYIYTLGKALLCSTLYLSSFPSVAFETVPMLVLLITALSHPFKEDCQALPLSRLLSPRWSTVSSSSCLRLVLMSCGLCNLLNRSESWRLPISLLLLHFSVTNLFQLLLSCKVLVSKQIISIPPPPHPPWIL